MWTEQFPVSAKEAFDEVLGPLGLKITSPFPDVIEGFNDYVCIDIVFHYGTVGTSLKSLKLPYRRRWGSQVEERALDLTYEPLPTPDLIEYVDLGTALEVLAPVLSEKERYPQSWGVQGLTGEVRRQCVLIATYLRPLLDGSEESWGQLRRFMQYGCGTFQLENEDIDSYKKRLKDTASTAYHNREYWRASRYYRALHKVTGNLSLTDTLLFWNAKRHTVMLP